MAGRDAGRIRVRRENRGRRQTARLIASLIGAIDSLLSRQVSEILHQPEFQRLEASWRGLEFLFRTAQEVRRLATVQGAVADIKIRVLTVRQRELEKDFESAVEFDQNALFKKVYEDEFGHPGGEPFGLLVADFEFSNSPSDLDLLERMGSVAAAAFAPLIAAAAPALLGLESFTQLERPIELQPDVQGRRYGQWRRLRTQQDARFLGLTMPRFLLRTPYRDDGINRFGFRFAEHAGTGDRKGYLWGSSAWALAAAICRAFGATAWFADIRGMQRGKVAGGLVPGLP